MLVKAQERSAKNIDAHYIVNIHPLSLFSTVVANRFFFSRLRLKWQIVGPFRPGFKGHAKIRKWTDLCMYLILVSILYVIRFGRR